MGSSRHAEESHSGVSLDKEDKGLNSGRRKESIKRNKKKKLINMRVWFSGSQVKTCFLIPESSFYFLSVILPSLDFIPLA